MACYYESICVLVIQLRLQFQQNDYFMHLFHVQSLTLLYYLGFDHCQLWNRSSKASLFFFLDCKKNNKKTAQFRELYSSAATPLYETSASVVYCANIQRQLSTSFKDHNKSFGLHLSKWVEFLQTILFYFQDITSIEHG